MKKNLTCKKKKKLTCNSPSTMKQPLTSGIYMLLLLTWKNDSIIILLKWISLSTKTLIDVTKVFYYIVGYKTFVLIFLVHTFSWWFSWNRNRWSYLTDWRIPEVWITWIKYCWYRFRCFYQSKPFIALSVLVILPFKMFDIYIYDELVGFQSFLFTNFIHIFWRFFLLVKRKRLSFLHLRSLNDNSPHSTKNHGMHILLQQSLNLIFSIPTLLFWYISYINQMCLISTKTLL